MSFTADDKSRFDLDCEIQSTIQVVEVRLSNEALTPEERTRLQDILKSLLWLADLNEQALPEVG
jgi:hypothetical protein